MVHFRERSDLAEEILVFGSVIFVHEEPFCSQLKAGQVLSGEKYHIDSIQGTLQHGGGSIYLDGHTYPPVS